MDKQATLMVRIPAPLRKKVGDASKKNGMKLYAIVEQALEMWLKSKEEKPA